MQVLSAPQLAGVGVSLITLVATALNVFIGLRLAALQAKIKADESMLEVSLVKQFVGWKSEVVMAINDKYVSVKLAGEIKENLRAELAQIKENLRIELMQIDKRLERIEERERTVARCPLEDARCPLDTATTSFRRESTTLLPSKVSEKP